METGNTHSAFLTGARDISPILLGVVPFGLIAGVATISIGLTSLHAVGLSLIVFAGAAQLAPSICSDPTHLRSSCSSPR